MAGRGRNNIHYVKQSTPSFIQNFKDKVGYKEPDNVESKFKKLEKSSCENDEDCDGEKPVVVLGKNVTAEEADEFFAIKKEDEGDIEECDHEELEDEDKDDDKKEKGKCVFRKPTKRKSNETGKEKHKGKHRKKSSSSMKGVKNSSLLSFGADEEEG